MSYSGLLNGTCVIWRPTQTRTGLGDTPFVYASVGTESCRVDAQIGRLQDLGPGEQKLALPLAFFASDSAVQARDVIVIASGPGVGNKWRVLMPEPVAAGTSSTHHVESEIEAFEGDLP